MENINTKTKVKKAELLYEDVKFKILDAFYITTKQDMKDETEFKQV